MFTVKCIFDLQISKSICKLKDTDEICENDTSASINCQHFEDQYLDDPGNQVSGIQP